MAAAAGPGGDVLWDNGISFENGLSHLTTPDRRSILDDFEAGPLWWSVTDFHLKYAWSDGTTMTGTDLELVFYGDDGGQPDFSNVEHIAYNRTYSELRDPNNPNFFGLTVVDIWVTFDKFILSPGTYLVDMHVVGGVNGFQVIGEFPPNRGAPVWVDYADFGGRQPGFEIFGANYDVNFVITGKNVPARPRCGARRAENAACGWDTSGSAHLLRAGTTATPRSRRAGGDDRDAPEPVERCVAGSGPPPLAGLLASAYDAIADAAIELRDRCEAEPIDEKERT